MCDEILSREALHLRHSLVRTLIETQPCFQCSSVVFYMKNSNFKRARNIPHYVVYMISAICICDRQSPSLAGSNHTKGLVPQTSRTELTP
ncbi:hypothetical protein CY34DRAFT_369494 [Suillus luteus UH-Slu-Lm8-n1]|uniref:Uncharacterized protein n=1 Tax=Suillus luteus UH-Slu-Lm8-n1 TaxID=930992 RepID=A0A0D0A989_9AGAM|nr:hypothetical protein CY34DRAFT_369494 [Suillus luteus UH-Slu-Lm8-n1]